MAEMLFVAILLTDSNINKALASIISLTSIKYYRVTHTSQGSIAIQITRSHFNKPGDPKAGVKYFFSV